MGRPGDDSAELRQETVEDLLERLLRALAADDPLRPVLEGDLRQRLRHAPPASGADSAEEAAAFLSRKAAGSRSGKGALAMLLALALVPVLAALALAIHTLIPRAGDIPEAPRWLRQMAHERRSSLPMEEAPQAGGTGYRIEDVAASKAAWQAHPDDPMFFFQYAMASMNGSFDLPEGYEKTWRRIDGDNGIWLLLEAEKQGGGTGQPVKWCVDLIQKAAAMPRVHSYRQDWFNHVRSHSPPPRSATDLMLWRREMDQWGLSDFMAFTGMRVVVANLMQAATDPAEKDNYRRLLREITAEIRPPVPKSGVAVEPAPMFEAPMWLAARLGTLATAVILVGVAGAAALRLLPSRGAPGRMARSLVLLRRPGDTWCLVLGAVPVPVALAVVTPALSDGWMSLAWLVHPAVTLLPLVILALLVTLGSRRVSRRIGFLGFGRSRWRREVDLLVAGLAVLNLAALPLLMAAQPRDWVSRTFPIGWVTQASGVLAAAVGIWLLVKVLLGFTSPEANIRHRVIARSLIPACLASAALVACCSIALYPVETSRVAEALADFPVGMQAVR